MATYDELTQLATGTLRKKVIVAVTIAAQDAAIKQLAEVVNSNRGPDGRAIGIQ